MRPLASMVLKSTRRILLSLKCELDFQRLGQRVGGHGACGDPAGSGEIAIHQRRRDGEDIADVIEAVAKIVGGKAVFGAEFDGEEIAYGVGVLAARLRRRAVTRPGSGFSVTVGLHRTPPAGTGGRNPSARDAAYLWEASRRARILRTMMSQPSRLLVSDAA